ncbi:MAG: signal peptidase II [Candidatus Gracilibacteria bacterium]|nr:signal peptidase II [Candidatus Gracilibacteria bacterium]
MFYILIIFLIFLDLITKYLAKINLLEQKSLIGDFLYLKYVENIGIAFGIPLTGILLKILTISIIGIIFWYYLKEEKNKNNKFINFSFILILAGALGNGYERIFNSKVIDFIGVKYFSVFNLADIFITIGVFIYILVLIFKKYGR